MIRTTAVGLRTAHPVAAGRAGATLLLAVSAAWAVFVLAIYYEKLWTLIAAGPAAWSVPDLGQNLRATGLPFLGDAMTRAARGIPAAALVVIAMIGAGRTVDRWLVPPGLTLYERPRRSLC